MDIVERSLAPLMGRTLSGWGREANMLSLQFGAEGSEPFTLHVFCAWRIAHDGDIIVGAGDLYTPADPDADIDTFDWDEPGSTWWDERLSAFLHTRSMPPRVESARTDEFGGFRLMFDDGTLLDVFPTSAAAPHVETEFWRLVPPGVATSQVIADTAGIRVEPQS